MSIKNILLIGVMTSALFDCDQQASRSALVLEGKTNGRPQWRVSLAGVDPNGRPLCSRLFSSSLIVMIMNSPPGSRIQFCRASTSIRVISRSR